MRENRKWAAERRRPAVFAAEFAKPRDYTGLPRPAGSLAAISVAEKRCRIRQLRRLLRRGMRPAGPRLHAVGAIRLIYFRQCCANSGCSSPKPARCASRRCSWWRPCGPTSSRARMAAPAASSSRRRRPRRVAGARVASYADAAKKAMPSVVNIYTSKEVRSRNPLADDPLFRRYFPDFERAGAAADEPRLRRDRRVRRLRAHQPSRDPGRRRHPARALRRPPRGGARARHRSRNPTSRCSRPTSENLPAMTFAAADDLAGRRRRARDRQSVRPRQHGHARHRERARPQLSRASTASRTSSRPTPRSIPATRAAR